jgi:hypothetical protein
VHTTPEIGSRQARSARVLGALAMTLGVVTARDGLTLDLNACLRRARPDAKMPAGEAIPQPVHDASKLGRPLLTATFADALDWLGTAAAVPLEQLYEIPLAFIRFFRARRGVRAPDLATAMRAEEGANAALNLRQWCGSAIDDLTDGELEAIEHGAGVQVVASMDLMCAAREERERRAIARARQAMTTRRVA